MNDYIGMCICVFICFSIIIIIITIIIIIIVYCASVCLYKYEWYTYSQLNGWCMMYLSNLCKLAFAVVVNGGRERQTDNTANGAIQQQQH